MGNYSEQLNIKRIMGKIKLIVALLLVINSRSVFCQSAIGQLENMTGQKINRYNTGNSSGYDMNQMISGMIAQSLINSIFNPGTKKYVQVNEVKVQPTYLVTDISGEKQKVNETLKVEKYKRLMKAYKKMHDTSGIQYWAFQSKYTDLHRLDSAWLSSQQKLIRERMEYENLLGKKISERLASPVPPLGELETGMSLKKLKPGDVLLFEPNFSNFSEAVQGLAVVGADGAGELLGRGTINDSKISHTITFLREESGKRYYMDNMPNEGPVIISEEEMKKRYTGREASVAQLQKGFIAQPLNPEESEKLWAEAIEMQKKNIELREQKGYDDGLVRWENTMYGTWGKDNVVCSEASWALLKSTGRDLPLSRSWVTQSIGVGFSPSDFYNYKQTFLVTKLKLTE